jgi:hypothetical protein
MPAVLTRLLFVCLVTVALAAPATAQASSHQTMSFEAPRELVDASQRDQAFDKIQSLGASSLRVILYWQDVAPSPKSAQRPKFDATDPTQYDWSRYDPILTGAARRGWSVILTVTGPVPRWATASKKDNLTRPSAKEFQSFMTALGKHYGSQVNTWAIWNEPNHPSFLLPQFSAKGHKPLSPGIYRQLFLGAWRGLRAAGQGRDRMLMGETAPRGTGAVVAPLTFLRGALCLSNNYVKRRTCSNLPADGYAHHAYSTRLGPFFKPPGPNDVTIGVLGRLVRALDRAASAGAIKRGMGIYLTEFGIQSKPDPFYGVTLAQQAEYYAISERIAYRNSRVRSFSQYLLRDDDAACCGGRYGGFESGLEFASGKIKRPAYDGFRLPLVAMRSGGRVSLWGRVRPARARTTAQILVADKGKGFHRLRTVRTDTRGVWTTRTSYRKGRRWRLRWKAADGTVFTGPPIRPYTSRGKAG